MTKFFEKGNSVPTLLLASAIFAIASILGITIMPNTNDAEAEIRIEPLSRSLLVGETLEVEVIVEASTPVNVFAGELRFDHEVLNISSIDYNTSIADLWAELPWYSNGDGTLNFGGGTTMDGGFTGKGTLIKVTFEAKREGRGVISLYETRILHHDGLGRDVALSESKDAIFTVERPPNFDIESETPFSETEYAVVTARPSTDLNDDGEQSIADVSVLLLNLASDNLRYDLNLDGEVSIKDLSILLEK